MTLKRSLKCMNHYVIKVRVIQKSSKFFFADILHGCIELVEFYYCLH
jgi:hypothetical protein